MSLQLRILTPTGTVMDGAVKSVTASGLKGEFGVLGGHLPFVTALKIGPAVFTEAESFEPRNFALGSGYAEVINDRVTLFVESAEEATTIDVERAKRALARAEKEMDELPDLQVTHPDYIRVLSAKQRAENRLFVSSL